MSNKKFNETFSSTFKEELQATKTSGFNSTGFETKKKSTVLPEEDLKKIGVMNLIINEFDESTWNKRQINNITRERVDAIDKVSRGELTKELAMLACYKI